MIKSCTIPIYRLELQDKLWDKYCHIINTSYTSCICSKKEEMNPFEFFPPNHLVRIIWPNFYMGKYKDIFPKFFFKEPKVFIEKNIKPAVVETEDEFFDKVASPVQTIVFTPIKEVKPKKTKIVKMIVNEESKSQPQAEKVLEKNVNLFQDMSPGPSFGDYG